jgi:sterol desaturase/sphingolipid hydroxylase (fatty acid hydroxylase superfamily)
VLNWFLKPGGRTHAADSTAAPSAAFAISRDCCRDAFGHVKVAHHPVGGKIFRNHINFHHTHYSGAHLVSRTYLGDEGNTTPYFLIPVFLVGACAYFLLPLNYFFVMIIASAASFYAHVFFDKQYHLEGSRLQRFAWFRRYQELHFVHHRHANSNFGVIHFFWDKILGTYRSPDGGA